MRSSLTELLVKLSCLISLGVYLVGPGDLSAATTEKTVTLEHRRMLVGPDSVRLALRGSADSIVLLISGRDTLQLGRDFTLQQGRLNLFQPPSANDTVLLITRRKLSLHRRQYSLRPFLTTTADDFSNTRRRAQLTKTAPESDKLQVSGTKSFWADVSDHGSVKLSQGLALTLNGDVGHGIIVRGSFADRGFRNDRLVTKRFSELQNIYLEVESEHLGGRFGNFELEENRFAYLGYNRNVQGLSLSYTGAAYSLSTSLSVPPGNFATNSFVTVQGNYGPYLLRDDGGASGIIVLENSETVWLNGRKLNRGRDEDYYLDYFRGELYFTGTTVIDEADRVRVDFEYQKQEYRKTFATLAASGELGADRLKLSIGAASLTDAKDAPLDFALSAEEEAVLDAAGDDRAKAVLPGARFVGANQGNYLLIADTLFGEIYRFVGDSLGDYLVSFSQSDTGDYIYLGSGEYRFVGKGTGNYLPVKTVPMPGAATVAGLAADYQLSRIVAIHSELAFSDFDRNRLSGLDDGDNAAGAGNIRLSLGTPQSRLAASVSTEYLPAAFFRFRRLDSVDEDYLWQRPTERVGDRRRYLATLSSSLTEHDRSSLEVGYTSETTGLEALRAGLLGSIEGIAGLRLDLAADLASSRAETADRSLVSLRPTVSSRLSLLEITLAGRYDHQEIAPAGVAATHDSRRELGLTLSRSGISLGVRQREDWQQLDNWEMLSRKRTFRLQVDGQLPQRGKIGLNLMHNRVDRSADSGETYETGNLDLLWQDLLQFIDLNSSLRLNRRGRWQTRDTFIKVEQGEGDYVLVDSVYVLQPRGDYISITEQVGSLDQTVEAQKQFRTELDLEHLLPGSVLRGLSFRYDINMREIGSVKTGFAPEWLLPPANYFQAGAGFHQQRQEYRLKRYDARIGLKTEFAYELKEESNLLEIRRPSESNSEQTKIILSKRLGSKDLLELSGSSIDTQRSQPGRYELNIKKQLLAAKLQHFVGPWELSLEGAVGRERADSLDLQLHSYAIEPQLSYSLSNLGRATAAAFLFLIDENEDRAVLREMADGYPSGANFGGDLRVEFRVAANFDFKLNARGEIRDGDDNRYYLRSELIARFQ